MEVLVKKIKALFVEFNDEVGKIRNKAAARRARKLSLEIERSLKLYRKESVK